MTADNGVVATQNAGAPQSPSTLAESSKRLLPWLVAVAFFMESLDTTILNTAVPAIAEALNVAPLSMKSVLASYTLSLAVFIPISGWMADRFGTRRVFASAIGLFTLGSIFCGLSSEHPFAGGVRAFCRGAAGAMMVPVGRLTLVRTFAKSELIRAMSFVAIPALIGPMLGPIAGGLIVGYLHWRLIFFVNIPIGLGGPGDGVPASAGLSRGRRRSRSTVVGLILFGSGVALLSYVLEIFGEHAAAARGDSGAARRVAAAVGGLCLSRAANTFPLLRTGAISESDVSRFGEREFFHAPGDRRRSVPAAAALSGGAGIHADSVGAADHAAGDGGDGMKLTMPRILARSGIARC